MFWSMSDFVFVSYKLRSVDSSIGLLHLSSHVVQCEQAVCQLAVCTMQWLKVKNFSGERKAGLSEYITTTKCKHNNFVQTVG